MVKALIETIDIELDRLIVAGVGTSKDDKSLVAKALERIVASRSGSFTEHWKKLFVEYIKRGINIYK